MQELQICLRTNMISLPQMNSYSQVSNAKLHHVSGIGQYLLEYFPNFNGNNNRNWIKAPVSTTFNCDIMSWVTKE